ncbi:HEXXH motif-containing putative peptide modification protein [Lentzea sp. NPDC051838]|uniref:aKG-HExxH-type peptide beta-hydroxylase n=1 Tax=Lentzea sp. NPDC051838 TaxID=3154849 RepID=UPI00343E9265
MLSSESTATHVLHAAIAPAEELVDERRTLYRLAADLFGVDPAELSDNLVDHPIVRYEIGRALAGHGDLTSEQLRAVAAMGVRDAGVPVASDASAAAQLEAPLRIIKAPGTTPLPLTEADGQRFESAVEIVAEGVALLRRVAPEMAGDLLAHVSMVAVLNRDTSGGVVSASSRYAPGIVLIDEPSTPIEVAEALVHEGAHEKFFDLAITREFLDSHAEEVEPFRSSWGGVPWPLEQVYAAWHAYSCLAQFSRLYGDGPLGPDSLLAVAAGRATEIGRWLLDHESDIGVHARWLLRSFMGEPGKRSEVDSGLLCPEVGADDRFRVRSDVRTRRAASGRVVVGQLVSRPPSICWLSADASWLVSRLAVSVAFGSVLDEATELWAVDSGTASLRLRAALGSLLSSLIIEPVS